MHIAFILILLCAEVRENRNKFTMTKQYTFFALFLLISLCSCGDDEKVIGSLALDEYTPENNLIIGRAIDAEANNIYNVVTTEEASEVVEYINQIFDLVINTSTIRNREIYDWQISLIADTTQTTVFSVPNGHIYIYSGLLNFLETESQLLALLAHETYYIDEGVGTTYLESVFSKTQLGDIILQNGAADVVAMAAELPSIKFSPNSVEAADQFSVELLCPYVYEPRGLVKILEKTTLEGVETPDWLIMRPADDISVRMETLNQMAEPCGLDGVKNEARYQEFLQKVLEL